MHKWSLWPLLSQEAMFLCLIIPGPSARQLGNPYSPKHAKLKWSSLPVLNCSPCPFWPFRQKPQQRLWSKAFFCSCLLPPDRRGIFLMWSCMAHCTSFSRTCEGSKLCFPEPLLCLLSLSPLKKNSRIILTLLFLKHSFIPLNLSVFLSFTSWIIPVGVF